MITRRHFLMSAGAGLSAAGTVRSRISPNEKIVLGFMGVNGRGSDLAGGFVNQPNVEIGYVCDVDDRAIAKCLAIAANKQTTPPKVSHIGVSLCAVRISTTM